MTARLWWTFGLTLGLVACTGPAGTDTKTDEGDDDDDTDTVGDDDDDDTVDEDSGSTDDSGTGGGGGGFEPYYFTAQASFGFDPDLGIVNTVTPQGENQSAVLVLIGTEDWYNDGFSYDSDEFCLVLLPLLVAPVTPPAFVVDNNLYFGVEYDSVDGAGTSCTGDYALDASWGQEPGYVFADSAYMFWGVGVGEQTFPAPQGFFTNDILPFVAGGRIENNFFADPAADPNADGLVAYFTLAQELDANQTPVVDANNYPVYIPADEIPALGTPMAHAEYTVLSYYVYSFGP